MKRAMVFSLLFLILFSYRVYGAAYESLPSVTTVKINDEIEITPKRLDEGKTKGVKIDGIVPSVSGNEKLKNLIERVIATEKGSATSGNVQSLAFTYTIVQSDKYDTISFLITSTSTSGSSMDKVSTVVIDKADVKSIAITDILGNNGLKIATSVVNNYIAKNYKNMPRIAELSKDASFYVTDEAVWFVFDKYEIAPGSEGVQSVPVYFDKIKTCVVERDEYYNNTEKYNVRMLPLRKVVTELGYGVKWNGADQEMHITKVDSDDYIPIKLNQNSYRRINETSAQVLEAAPEIKDGTTYVPISFMESILGLHYQVTGDGSIELATYEY